MMGGQKPGIESVKSRLISTGGGWPTRRLSTLAVVSRSVLSFPGMHDGMMFRQIIRSRDGLNNGFKRGFIAASCFFRARLSDERSRICEGIRRLTGLAAEP